jgi:hypothetical protein
VTDSAAFVWAAVLVVVLVVYVGACLLWPWASCGRCRGRGKLRSPTRRYHRSCPRCGGSGRLQRLPLRLFRSLRDRGRA